VVSLLAGGEGGSIAPRLPFPTTDEELTTQECEKAIFRVDTGEVTLRVRTRAKFQRTIEK
jgi:hypothetical protein